MDTLNLMISEKNADQLIKTILKRVKFSKFDGINLDCTQFWFAEDLYPLYVTFQTKLYTELHKLNKKLLITLFPFSESIHNVITKARLDYISRYADNFIIMTYDYLHYFQKEEMTESIVKNSPEPWVIKSLEYYVDSKKPSASKLYEKILLGYAFHGFVMDLTETKKLKGNTLEGEKLIEIAAMEKSKGTTIQWDPEDKEYTALISNDQSSYMAVLPSVKSIKKRISLIDKYTLGGLAVWDIGQGYESWMDAL